MRGAGHISHLFSHVLRLRPQALTPTLSQWERE